MTSNEIAYLALVVFVFSLFGAVLAWASWMDSRSRRGGGQ